MVTLFITIHTNKVIYIVAVGLQPGKDNKKYSMILGWGHNPGTQSYGTSESHVQTIKST